MTFQNSKISSAPNFEIVIEDQKMYFADYPDFPIFEKPIFPDEVWENLEIDFDKLFESIKNSSDDIERLYAYITDEGPKALGLERKKLESEKKINREDKKDNMLFIASLIDQAAPIIEKLYELRQTLAIKVIYSLGYMIEPWTWEISQVAITEFYQETDS